MDLDADPLPDPPADPRRRRALIRLSACGAGVLLPWNAASAAAASLIHALPRRALVIGNSRYPAYPLANPVRDARAIAATLGGMGFAVTQATDATRAQMEEAIIAFTRGLAKDKAIGLFYFAGHGLQLDWRNFLVPVDATLKKADDVPKGTIDTGFLLDGLSKAANPMNILILDACRDNPFGERLKAGKGLSQMDAPIGTLLAYATAPGNVASDGDGSNGLYTENLLREMRAPEAKIEDVFKRVRLSVRRASRGQQVPWESTSLEDDFFFIPPAEVRKLSEDERQRRYEAELAAWQQAQESDKVAPIEAYLRNYPSGSFADLAQLRLDTVLARAGESKVEVASSIANPYSKGTGVADVAYKVGDRYAYREIDLLTNVETKRWSMTVTDITDNHIIYNKGSLVYDRLGNLVKRPKGTRYGPSQFYALEYSIGRKWQTRYSSYYTNGKEDIVEIEFKVTAREKITVPAGTFDAFRVEARGWVLNQRLALEFTYWVAPDKVRRTIAIDTWHRFNQRITRADRQELTSWKQA